nr:hypothetical protein [Bacteroidaceae bacterium]
LTKADLMMLEIVSGSNWKRPIYAAITVGPENLSCFSDYFIMEGLAKRITPFSTKQTEKLIDTDKMYDNIMHKFKFGNVANPKVYLDENIMRMCNAHRRIMISLASELFNEGKKKKAKEVLDYSLKVLPENQVPLDYVMNQASDMAAIYYELGDKKTSEHLLKSMFDNSFQYARFYLSMNDKNLRICAEDCMMHMTIMNKILKQMEMQKSTLTSKCSAQFESLYGAYNSRSNTLTNY